MTTLPVNKPAEGISYLSHILINKCMHYFTMSYLLSVPFQEKIYGLSILFPFCLKRKIPLRQIAERDDDGGGAYFSKGGIHVKLLYK